MPLADEIVVDELVSAEPYVVKRDWRFWCIILSLSTCMLLTALEFVSDEQLFYQGRTDDLVVIHRHGATADREGYRWGRVRLGGLELYPR